MRREPLLLEWFRNFDKTLQIVTGRRLSHYVQPLALKIFPAIAKIDSATAYEKPADPDDPYNILDIPPSSPDWLVKLAYSDRARRAHPDRGGSNEEMKKVNNAFDKIKAERDM